MDLAASASCTSLWVMGPTEPPTISKRTLLDLISSKHPWSASRVPFTSALSSTRKIFSLSFSRAAIRRSRSDIPGRAGVVGLPAIFSLSLRAACAASSASSRASRSFFTVRNLVPGAGTASQPKTRAGVPGGALFKR